MRFRRRLAPPHTGFLLIGALLALGSALIAASLLAPPVLIPGGQGAFIAAIGDVNGDGTADLTVVNFRPTGSYSGYLSILLGNGNGTFQAPVRLNVGGDPSDLVLGDFDRNGMLDLAYLDNANSRLGTALGTYDPATGQRTFSATRFYPVGQWPQGIRTADVNGDRSPDVIVLGCDASIRIYVGDGAGNFTAAPSLAMGCGYPRGLGVGDIDGDGRIDIVADAHYCQKVSVFRGNGDGTFQARADHVIGGTPIHLDVADLNGDGLADVAVTDDGGAVAVLVSNPGAAGFTQTRYGIPGMGRGVVINDLTGDGILDIVAVSHNGSSVFVLTGIGGGRFEQARAYPAGVPTYSLAVGDVNGDHVPDVVAPPISGSQIALLFNGSVPPDTTPPTMTLPPSPITVGATSGAGAVVAYLVTVTDNVDPRPSLACAPASGSTFPLGATTVNCTARDAAGNVASASFTIAVVDQTPPEISLPAPVTADATGPSGAIVTFVVTATDAVDPQPLVQCEPSSGATFAAGTTTVNCTARDASGNTATGAFQVRVRGAAELLSDLRAAAAGLGPGSSFANKLAAVQAALAAGDSASAVSTLHAFINEVRAQTGKKLTVAQAAQLTALARRLAHVLGGAL